ARRVRVADVAGQACASAPQSQDDNREAGSGMSEATETSVRAPSAPGGEETPAVPPRVSIVTTYRRALGLLAPERGLAGSLVAANVAIGVILLAEPILFGHVVDALSQGSGAFSLIG